MAPASHTFVPVEPYTRVAFAAPGSDTLVVVEKDGLTVATSETKDVGGAEQEVPVNVDLLSILEEHPHVQEKGAAPAAAVTPPPAAPAPAAPAAPADPKE